MRSLKIAPALKRKLAKEYRKFRTIAGKRKWAESVGWVVLEIADPTINFSKDVEGKKDTEGEEHEKED